jgi:hypothetical protein
MVNPSLLNLNKKFKGVIGVEHVKIYLNGRF